MKHTLLGQSGLRVSELCLGGLTFGQATLAQKERFSSKQESFSILDYFASCGGTFIDTSNIYGNGSSERIIGEFVRQERHHFVVGTKFSFSQQQSPRRGGNSRKNMFLSVDESLKNLGTDYIDILWMHMWDEITPIDEVLRGFDDLVSSGKILYAGISNAPAWKICQAKTISELRGWNPLIAIQISYSLLNREAERELLPMARELNLGITAFEVLAQGLLSSNPQENPMENSKKSLNHEGLDKNQEARKAVLEVARELGVPPGRIALAYVRQNRLFGKIVPIIGARTLEQIKENLECIHLELPQELFAKIHRASAIELRYPHHDISHEETKRLLGDRNLLL